MKKTLLVLVALGSFTTAFASGRDSGGATPFTASANMLQVIFNTPAVWQKVGGSIDQITAVARTNSGTQFKIQTRESTPIVNSAGVTTGWTPSACTVIVDVAYNELTPKVTRVDLSACPAARARH